jgi:flagellar motor switch protein FliN/FliY
MADPDPTTSQQSTPKQPTSAEAMATDALRAAQQAVADIKRASTPSGGDPAAEALSAAQTAIAQAKANAAVAQPSASAGASPLELPNLESVRRTDAPGGMDLLADVNLNVKIELGRTRMLVEDVLRLGEGSVVELDKLAGDPVDVYVNDRPVARGEVLVLNDNFCIRINEIISQVSAEGA